jgi:hypothetical protein
MMDRNSRQIADLIDDWLAKRGIHSTRLATDNNRSQKAHVCSRLK